MRKLENDELGRKSPEEFRHAGKTPLILVLDDVRSALNVGSVFRTGDAFLVEKIILCGITATPPNKEINKTALGATETVTWEYREDILETLSELQAAGVKTYAVEQADGATMLNAFHPEPEATYALVFGNEVFGVSQEAVDACGQCLEIPQSGTKHSLNIAVSVGVVVWDICSKWKVGI
jgi:tRNA G18 (ribose-2'-O)-methylase SpoU